MTRKFIAAAFAIIAFTGVAQAACPAPVIEQMKAEMRPWAEASMALAVVKGFPGSATPEKVAAVKLKVVETSEAVVRFVERNQAVCGLTDAEVAKAVSDFRSGTDKLVK